MGPEPSPFLLPELRSGGDEPPKVISGGGGNDLETSTARRGDRAGGQLGQRPGPSGWEHPSPSGPMGPIGGQVGCGELKLMSTCLDSHWGLWPCLPRSGRVWALEKQAEGRAGPREPQWCVGQLRWP